MEKALIPMQIVVLAAGHGKRMNNSELPKVLVEFKGRPIIKHLLDSVSKSLVAKDPVIVVGQHAEDVKRELGPRYSYVYQDMQLGTGHAVGCTRDSLRGQADNIMVLYGDQPLLSAETINDLITTHLNNGVTVTLAVVKVADFDSWHKVFYDFGRIVRDGQGKIIRNIEKKDATQSELEIKEVNPSFYCFKAEWLWQNIDRLDNKNSQQEYYLTDLIGLAFEQKEPMADVQINPEEALGVNTLEQLSLIKNLSYERT